ncbi:MAG: hypothetical protein KDH96_11135, partial [Candidatus Riesia sp.]|nr:hypothetical protein [Candidatus Riesia sp.]
TGLALIGSDNTGAHFIGNVYNLATWSRVLSGSEIYDLAHFSFDYRNNYNNYVSNNLTEYYLDTVNESSYNLPNAINDTQYFVLAGTGSGVVSSEDLPSFPGNVKITFTSPNSSDTIEPFDNYVIEWSNLGPSERVELFLCSGSEIIDTVTLNASAASGTHIWSVGEYVSGDYYLIARNVISGIVGTSETFSYVNLYNTYSNGGLTVYPTSRLVHLFVSGNIPSSSQWEIRRSPDDVTYTKLNNPSPSYNTQGFYRNTTKYFVDGNVEPGSGYYYQLYSYDGSYTLSGQVYVTLPTAGADLFEDFTSNHPGIGLSRTGFNSISQVRSNLLLTEPVDYAFALQANLNQDQAGSLRSYNVNISGANFDYYSVESGSWSLQLNGLSQNDFLSTLTHVGSVVSNGMYLHYITNDVLVKERAMSAFRSFISQYTAYSGQYQDAFTITDYEGIVGSIFTSAYDVCYGYLTQDERDAFAQMSYNLARHITYTVGFDAARLGDTHSNEDTAILLKQLIVLLAGDITDSTLRSNIQSLFDSYLLIYSGVLDQY